MGRMLLGHGDFRGGRTVAGWGSPDVQLWGGAWSLGSECECGTDF